jgi:hypothetical protein
MVKNREVKEIRPNLQPEFQVSEFKSRSEAIADAYQWGKKLNAG